jgi:hypothetical protein
MDEWIIGERIVSFNLKNLIHQKDPNSDKQKALLRRQKGFFLFS